jgi:hypothetical protein
MSNTGGMLDTYLIAQALGWEWNLTTMIILTITPILIIIGILVLIFVVIPFILDLFD